MCACAAPGVRTSAGHPDRSTSAIGQPERYRLTPRVGGASQSADRADIYWQHLAYEQGGLAEIERIFRAGQLDRCALRGW
jgi:hypothetical protein